HHTPSLTLLAHRGVDQPRRQLPARPRRPTRPRLALGLYPDAIDLFDRRGVRRIGVAGQQHGAVAACAAIHLRDDLLTVLRRALAGHHGKQEAVLRIDCRVVPVVPQVVVAWVVGVAVLCLLGDEIPLLVELGLTGARGKKPRARRGGSWTARQRGRGSARWCPGRRR